MQYFFHIFQMRLLEVSFYINASALQGQFIFYLDCSLISSGQVEIIFLQKIEEAISCATETTCSKRRHEHKDKNSNKSPFVYK